MLFSKTLHIPRLKFSLRCQKEIYLMTVQIATDGQLDLFTIQMLQWRKFAMFSFQNNSKRTENMNLRFAVAADFTIPKRLRTEETLESWVINFRGTEQDDGFLQLKQLFLLVRNRRTPVVNKLTNQEWCCIPLQTDTHHPLQGEIHANSGSSEIESD